MSYKFKQGEKVVVDGRVSPDLTDKIGTITGVATVDLPVIGAMWIVSFDKEFNSFYPFCSIAVPEINLSLVTQE